MNKSGIFDRSNYSKKTLDTFEITTAYFVDIYYNHLYIEAKKLRTNKNVSSITEGYKHALNAFMQGIENPKLYKKTLIGIHGFFEASGILGISFADCIERITTEFIPKDYYDSVTKSQKTSLLKHVLCQSNKMFIEKLVRKFLPLIIDNHSDQDNIRILQDEFIDVIIMERENVYHLFISAQTNTVKSTIKPATVEAMQNEIKILYKDRFELKRTTTLLKKIILKKDNEVKQLTSENSELKNENVDLYDKISKLEEELSALQLQELSTLPKFYDNGEHTQYTPAEEIKNINPFLNTLNAVDTSNLQPLLNLRTGDSSQTDINTANEATNINLDTIDVEDIGKKVNREISDYLEQVSAKQAVDHNDETLNDTNIEIPVEKTDAVNNIFTFGESSEFF
jgi:hypothetical protein